MLPWHPFLLGILPLSQVLACPPSHQDHEVRLKLSGQLLFCPEKPILVPWEQYQLKTRWKGTGQSVILSNPFVTGEFQKSAEQFLLQFSISWLYCSHNIIRLLAYWTFSISIFFPTIIVLGLFQFQHLSSSRFREAGLLDGIARGAASVGGHAPGMPGAASPSEFLLLPFSLSRILKDQYSGDTKMLLYPSPDENQRFTWKHKKLSLSVSWFWKLGKKYADNIWLCWGKTGETPLLGGWSWSNCTAQDPESMSPYYPASISSFS